MNRRMIIIIVTVAAIIALVVAVFKLVNFINSAPKKLTGTVTRLSIDCKPSVNFADGKRTTETAALCDGGSGLAVDGTAVIASSGLVADVTQAWGKSLDGVEAGDKVEVTYVEKTSDGATYKSLDCDACGVTVVEKFKP